MSIEGDSTEPERDGEIKNPPEKDSKNNSDNNINPENKPGKHAEEERDTEKEQTTKIYKIVKEDNGEVKREEVEFTPQQIKKIKILKEAIEELEKHGRWTGSWAIYTMSQRLARKEGLEITLNAVRHTLNIGGEEGPFTKKRMGVGNKNTYGWNKNYLIVSPPPPPPKEPLFGPTIITPSGKEIPVENTYKPSDRPPLPGMENYVAPKAEDLFIGNSDIGEPPEFEPLDPFESYNPSDFKYFEESTTTIYPLRPSGTPEPPEEPPEDPNLYVENPKPKKPTKKKAEEEAKKLQNTLPGVD
jgi:hypothetical protein